MFSCEPATPLGFQFYKRLSPLGGKLFLILSIAFQFYKRLSFYLLFRLLLFSPFNSIRDYQSNLSKENDD